MKAIFVTTNEHKRQEVQEILGFELERADLDLPEIQAIDPAEKIRAAREALVAHCRCVGLVSIRNRASGDRSADGRKRDFQVASWCCTVDGAYHGRDPASDARPARRTQNDDCNTPRTEILLVAQVPVGRDENLESFLFGNIEQVAVLKG
jgi:hypothetical protein